MKITNKHNLPEAIYNAVSGAYPPREGSISVSRLADSPQIDRLMRKHWGKLTEDASDRLWALLGQAIHAVLDKHAPQDGLAEERLKIEINSLEIRGRSDLWHKEIVEDYKVTSVYAFLLGIKKEWENLLNIYAYMFSEQGLKVNGLKIHAILRDWKKSEFLKNKDYPPIPFISVDVPLWTKEEQLAYIGERIAAHKSETGCTDSERWHKPGKIALMQKGRKKAIRLFDTWNEAHKVTLADNQHFEERTGQDIRCESYCIVAKFCPQTHKV